MIATRVRPIGHPFATRSSIVGASGSGRKHTKRRRTRASDSRARPCTSTANAGWNIIPDSRYTIPGRLDRRRKNTGISGYSLCARRQCRGQQDDDLLHPHCSRYQPGGADAAGPESMAVTLVNPSHAPAMRQARGIPPGKRAERRRGLAKASNTCDQPLSIPPASSPGPDPNAHTRHDPLSSNNDLRTHTPQRERPLRHHEAR